MAINLGAPVNRFRPFMEDPNNPLSGVIGSAASDAVNMLLNHKMQEIAQGKRKQALLKAGLPAEYADLDPQSFQLLANHHLQEKSNRAFAQAQGLLYGNEPVGKAPMHQLDREGMQQRIQKDALEQLQNYHTGNAIFGGNQQRSATPGDVPELINQALYGGPKELRGMRDQLPFMGYGKQPQPQEMGMITPTTSQQNQQQPLIQGTKQLPNELLAQLSPQQQQKVRAIQAAQRKEQIDMANLALRQKKAEQSQEKFKHELSKDTREYLSPFFEQDGEIVKNIKSNKILIDTATKGNLRAGNIQQLLSKVGLENFNQPFDNEIAQKEIARLAQNIKTAFGGRFTRLTNYLEQTFQKSLPSLWNTPEGIIAISSALINTDEYNKAFNKARLDIVRENKGVIPWDIEAQTAERTEALKDMYEQRAIDALKIAELPYKTLSPAEQKEARKYGVVLNGVTYKAKNGYWQQEFREKL